MNHSNITKVVHDGPEPVLNLVDDKSSRGSKNGALNNFAGFYGLGNKMKRQHDIGKHETSLEEEFNSTDMV